VRTANVVGKERRAASLPDSSGLEKAYVRLKAGEKLPDT